MKAHSEAARVVAAAIENCQNMQPKFLQGTSQHSLLQNRIRALQICECLLNRGDLSIYSPAELQAALPPIRSIIHKCEKAQSKHPENSAVYRRLIPLLSAMRLSLALLETETAQKRI